MRAGRWLWAGALGLVIGCQGSAVSIVPGTDPGDAGIASETDAARGGSDANRPPPPPGVDAGPPPTLRGGLDLHLTNRADATRTAEVARVSVPVAEADARFDVAGLSVANVDGVAVPTDLRVLSRWGGARDDTTRPIRWLQATFLADVGANARATYRLAPAASTYPGTVSVSETGAAYDVSTSPSAHFVISKTNFSLLESAVIEGVERLERPAVWRIEMDDARSVTPRIVASSVEVLGTVRTTIRQHVVLDGSQTRAEPLELTVRWHFDAGRSEVELEVRLENPNAYGTFFGVPDGALHFERAAIEVPILGGARATTGIDSVDLPSDTALRIEQRIDHGAPDGDHGLAFEVSGPSGPLRMGERFESGLALTTSAGDVAVALDRFWQNAPKALEARPDALVVELFPAFGHGPEVRGQYAAPWETDKPVLGTADRHYRLEGGRWKSHQVRLAFGAASAVDPASLAARVRAPLVGLVEPGHLRGTNALGLHFVERRETDDVPERRYERFFDVLVDDSVADPATSNPSDRNIGLPKFIERRGTYGRFRYYGWENFGDLGWGEGFSNLHYDWTRAMLLGWARTGDARFFERGRDMAVYRRDYGQNHSRDEREFWRGASYYEKGWWHGNYRFGEQSHNWVTGLLLYYVLTGDEGAREAALENLAYTLRRDQDTHRWAGSYGIRFPGWAIEGLLDGYQHLGDRRYLQRAKETLDHVASLETVIDGAPIGVRLDPMDVRPSAPYGTTQTWMHAIFFIAASRYVLLSGDRTQLPFLQRMADWFMNEATFPATGPDTARALPAAREYWWPGIADADARPSTHHLWSIAEALAFAALLTDDAAYATRARELFAVTTRYWQQPARASVDVTSNGDLSPINARPTMFPNSETKVFGNLLRWGHAVMVARERFALP